MAIYDGAGVQLYACYDGAGGSLNRAYDGAGNVIFQAGAIPLKVMEYNVGGWYIGTGTNVPAAKDSSYYQLQSQMIADADADILCMCEYWDMFSPSRTALSMLQQYYPYIHAENGTDTYFGRCICSKYPIVDYTVNVYADDAAGRYYDKATVNVGGMLIDVIITHLHPSDQDEKIRTAHILFEYTQTLTRPWIICGDFNSTLYDPFSEVNAAIYNQFLNAGDTIANGGALGILNTACNSADWSQAFAIDNIIVSPDIVIESVTTDLTKTTDQINDTIDHVPLIAQVSIT